jgi:hypothetical protein
MAARLEIDDEMLRLASSEPVVEEGSDPDARWRSTEDVVERRWIAAAPRMAGGNTIESPLRGVRLQSLLVAALGVALVAALVVWAPWLPALMPPETRTEIVTPATADPTSFALSPDGRQMVFVASGDGPSRLWLRSLAAATAQPLSGTEGATSPFWAPDSRAIGFFAGAR